VSLHIKDIKKGDVISITGGGGKTSLMFFLAEKLAETGRVAVTTTTKIYIPDEKSYEKMYVQGEVTEGLNKNIFVIGDKRKGDKLSGLTYDSLEVLKGKYDYILVEADGARERMLKGWNETEPCIPPFADMTIGVVNIKSLGKSVVEKDIHRLSKFCEVTGEKTGTVVDRKVLENYINTGDFFRESQGRNIVYLNGIETVDELKTGIEMGKTIENLYLGSIWNGWIERYKSVDAVVMASGYSKRFGGEKLFEEVGGMPLIEYLLKKLKNIPFNKVIVVGRDERSRALAERYGYEYAENKKAHLGQSESVKAGAKRSTGEGVMFFPGDQMMLTEKSILTLIEEYQKRDEIVRPEAGGIPSSPVIFPKRYIEDLLKIEGDSGGREVIKGAEKVFKIRFEDIHEFIDIDTRQDLEEVVEVMKLKPSL